MKPASIAPAYVAFYPLLTEIAREYGYSLAIHGSVKSDMDLIAIPWVNNAKPVEQLVNAIQEYSDKVMQLMFKDPAVLHGPEQKPHNRIAYTIQIGNGFNIYLSIMKPVKVINYESLSETDKQILAIMLLRGTEKQRLEALEVLRTKT